MLTEAYQTFALNQEACKTIKLLFNIPLLMTSNYWIFTSSFRMSHFTTYIKCTFEYTSVQHHFEAKSYALSGSLADNGRQAEGEHCQKLSLSEILSILL